MTILMAAAGGALPVVEITVSSVTVVEVDPSNATAGVIFASNGEIRENRSGTTTTVIGSWWGLAPVTGIGNNYDVRVRAGGGTLDFQAAADDTWIQISTDRQYNVQQNVIGINAVTRDYEIRRTGSGGAIDTRSITLTAQVSL